MMGSIVSVLDSQPTAGGAQVTETFVRHVLRLFLWVCLSVSEQ